MAGFRHFLRGGGGQLAGIVLFVAALGVCGYVAYSTLLDTQAARSNSRVFVDAGSGETFRRTLEVGMREPVESPDGDRDGYIAEPCYWTASGGVKEEPTWVLVKTRVDPEAGPTFCPDCGHLVVERNPPSGAGVEPPPKEGEAAGSAGADDVAEAAPAPAADRDGRGTSEQDDPRATGDAPRDVEPERRRR